VFRQFAAYTEEIHGLIFYGYYEIHDFVHGDIETIGQLSDFIIAGYGYPPGKVPFAGRDFPQYAANVLEGMKYYSEENKHDDKAQNQKNHPQQYLADNRHSYVPHELFRFEIAAYDANHVSGGSDDRGVNRRRPAPLGLILRFAGGYGAGFPTVRESFIVGGCILLVSKKGKIVTFSYEIASVDNKHIDAALDRGHGVKVNRAGIIFERVEFGLCFYVIGIFHIGIPEQGFEPVTVYIGRSFFDYGCSLIGKDIGSDVDGRSDCEEGNYGAKYGDETDKEQTKTKFEGMG
jgi:hypothetical protein